MINKTKTEGMNFLFGYVRPYAPELKMKEYDAFRAVYCGLCHQLGRSFGFWYRLTLNYDFVFLALLYYGQHKELPEVTKGRCAVNPLQKVPLCALDKGMVFSSDIASIMIYYKIKDNISDTGKLPSIGWKFAEKFFRGSWRKAAQREPEADKIISDMMLEQKKVEENKTPSLDAASDPTAKAFSEIAGKFFPEDSSDRAKMERLGYLVGRYVYLCDAVDDIEDDCKHQNYNPLIYRYLDGDFNSGKIEYAKEQAKSALYMTIGEMSYISNDIEFTCFKPIISNIIDMGMKQSLEDILNKEGKTSDEGSL